MWMSSKQYREKLEGCWLGKNIGGTLGQPFEGVQGILDIDFYTQDLHGQPVPNDDLDLQLVWLVAAEKYGSQVNSTILGEYWLSHIHPNWSEYGFAKNNLRKGLIPPLSGSVDNSHHNSNGAWIRSEIWACLAPGRPDVAASYACEDSSVDHCDEGVYSAAFCAALQSAAFVESDKYKLIDIGLSYIPEDSGVAKAVRSVIENYHQGLTWIETRKRLLTDYPHDFGSRMEGEIDPEIPRGETGYDAPSNIGIFILGWLYGEDDFAKSICLAVNCGVDTDCTAATLAAVWGIIHGADGIPSKWKEPIGRSIKTCCLNGDMYTAFPESVDELMDRIMRVVPRFLDLQYIDSLNPEGYQIKLQQGEALYNQPPGKGHSHPEAGYHEYYFNNKPYAVRYDTPLYYCWFDYQQAPYAAEDEPFEVKLNFHNRVDLPQWLSLKWTLPESWHINAPLDSSLMLPHHFGEGRANTAFTIVPGAIQNKKYDLYLDIQSEGRHTRLVIPVTLYAGT